MAYTGKILIADLTSPTLKEQVFEDRIYRDFIGGVGLGVRLLYEYLPKNVEPLQSQNILGFMPGLLGGTSVPSSSRLTVVGKSPLTGGWGDANVGGFIGYEIKRAGYDGILFFGASVKPVYLLLYQGKAELRDATHLWGKDTVETEDILRAELGDNSLRVACIGQAGEKLSLISSIITEKGRAAARSGLGAVMGAKRLKAIAVKGHTTVPVADSLRVRELQRKFIDEVKNTDVKFIDTLKTMGTAGSTEGFIVGGATPIQNWTLNGKESIPSDFKPYGEGIAQYLTKRGTCARCPIGCKGTVFTEETGECNSPEYETIAAFGPLCLNNDIKSIIRAGDICNRYGIDTISVGNAIAFAIECYQEGIISRKDTGGIALAWNDQSAMIAMLQKIVNREGFGNILADGVKIAAEKIGHGAIKYAVNVGGQEPGFHDPRQVPARGVGYFCDPTPGRHTSFMAGTILERNSIPGPYVELWGQQPELHDYANKSATYGVATKYEQVLASSGSCKFIMFQKSFPLIDFIAAATGWDINPEEVLLTGERIQTLRQLFNIREGIRPVEFHLPERVSQPATTGPFKQTKIDFELLRRQYYKAMNWDPETGHPLAARLQQLGLEELITGNKRE